MPEREDHLPFKMSQPEDVDGPPEPEQRVAGPANGLMLVAALALLSNCIGVGVMNSVLFKPQETARPPGVSEDEFSYAERGRQSAPFLYGCAVGLPTLLVCTFALMGAVQMKNLRSWRQARTSAILVMLPCSPAFLLGIPIGIWALAVLNDPDVKRAFRYGGASE